MTSLPVMVQHYTDFLPWPLPIGFHISFFPEYKSSSQSSNTKYVFNGYSIKTLLRHLNPIEGTLMEPIYQFLRQGSTINKFFRMKLSLISFSKFIFFSIC